MASAGASSVNTGKGKNGRQSLFQFGFFSFPILLYFTFVTKHCIFISPFYSGLLFESLLLLLFQCSSSSFMAIIYCVPASKKIERQDVKMRIVERERESKGRALLR